MGNLWSANQTKGTPSSRLLMVGLDAAGKTTIMYKLRMGEVVTTIPTIGFNVETIETKDFQFTTWDVGGEDKIRALWRHYYQNTSHLVFVIDCNDRYRVEQVQEQLSLMLHEEDLEGIPLLIFANKQDLPNVMTTEEIQDILDLNSIKNRAWFVQPCIATNGEGLYEGLSWLSEAPYNPQRLAKAKSARN